MVTPSYDLDAMPKSLLTTSNPKTAKGEGHGYLTAILHLAPASLSGRNVCPHSTAGCRAACLNTAGRGGVGLDADELNVIQVARIRRTRYFQRDRGGFMRDLAIEISRHVCRANEHGLAPAVRLNGTSDLPWERLRAIGGLTLMQIFPQVAFYDYTKWPLAKRGQPGALDVMPPNYSLCYSLSEHRDAARRAAEYLAAGHSVAAVYATKKGAELPHIDLIGDSIRRVTDGDAHDLRFLDDPGVIVGLRAKGRAKQDTSGFVRAA